MKSPEPAFAESLSGIIERVTFFNEETGFAVLRVKAKGQRDLVTVVGNLAAVNPGEWLTAEGNWGRDPVHGLQFKASMLSSTPPTSAEGIEKYLGSGMVKGIGPVYAKKLAAKFGVQIFDIIENFSARLEDVEGIGPGRRRKIKEAWAEQKFIREIMVFLHSNGVSTSRAVRIYKTYGDGAIEKVRENPYRLAADISGIGFKTADEIARKIGIPRDSILRAGAGLTHVLLEAVGVGHCALPRERLIEGAAELLGVEQSIVTEALNKQLANGELSLETIGGETLLFLPYLRQAEIGIARGIRSRAAGAARYPPMDLEKALVWCQTKTGKELAPSQREALKTALTHPVVIITGGPGVGKTTLIDSLLKILTAKKVRCLLCAPTGRAAKRLSESTGMEAKTIHRLLEFQAGAGGFSRNETRPLECDLLVVDEVSMVDAPLMHLLLRAHPEGAGLILAGDVDQLPSVGPGLVLQDLIASGAVPVVRLTEVFRQAAASRIITSAHRINQGQLPEAAAKHEPSDFFFIQREEPGEIADVIVDMAKRGIPGKLGCDAIRDVQVLCPMNRGSVGVRELNLRLQNELNPARPGEEMVEKFGWQFRPRDKVIQTENNYDKEVFNGDIGQIARVDPIEREVVIRFDQREAVYDFGELDEVSLAYAITVHKSQGSEFPAVIMPVATQQYRMLQRNLIYTGITRGRRLVVLVGQIKALGMAVRNQSASRRYSGLLARLQEE